MYLHNLPEHLRIGDQHVSATFTDLLTGYLYRYMASA